MNWSQLKTILWLQNRLRWRRFSRGGRANRFGSIVITVFGCLAIPALAIATFFAGRHLPASATANSLLVGWDVLTGVFLFWWMLGVISDFQISDIFDLQRFLHFPTTLRELFFVNYVAGCWAISSLVFVLTSTCWTLGAASAGHWPLLAMLPLVFSFFTAVTAWTHSLRTWILRKMENPRRRKSILMWLGVFVILIAQGPNLYFNAFSQGRSKAAKPSFQIGANTVHAHALVPFGWPGYAAWGLQQHRVLPVIWAIAASSALAAWGLQRAYQNTVNPCFGASTKTTGKAEPTPGRDASPNPTFGARDTNTLLDPTASSRPANLLQATTWMDLAVPILPATIAPLALGWLRSWSRATELRMMLVSVSVVTIFVGSTFFRKSTIPSDFTGPLFPASVIMVLALGFTQLFNNTFAYDRHGFRSIVLSPVNRRDLLISRNLAMACVVLPVGFFLLSLGLVTGRLSLFAWLCAQGQVLAGMFAITSLGNALSIAFPYPFPEAGTRRARPPAAAVLASVFTLIPVGCIMALATLPSLAGLWMNRSHAGAGALTCGIGSCFVLTASAIAYAACIDSQSIWLERREKAILQIITQTDS